MSIVIMRVVIFLKIDSNSEGKITVALSNEDMNELDITYDELDYSNIETRRVIWTLLDKAGQQLGKCINTDSKLLIEAAPLNEGGCILHFTFLPVNDPKSKKRLVMKKEADPILFKPFNENSMLDSVKLLSSLSNKLKSVECYKYKNKFYVSIYPKLTFSDSLIFILSEFGECNFTTNKEISFICEYGLPQRIDCFFSIGSTENKATGNENVCTCINAKTGSFGDNSAVNLN